METIMVDRISSLPDEVLSHILSYLELQEAVKTSILSKRWEKVWTWIHRISLSNLSCNFDPGMSLSLEEQRKRRIRFNNFINGILTGKNPRISFVKSFCLWYSHDENPYLIQWIDAVVTPNLESFEFRNGVGRFYPSIKMPRNLFQCPALVTLYLDSSYSRMIDLDVPEPVCLSNLVKLHLINVRFKDENCLKNLLLSSPVLEELSMGEIEDGQGRQNQNLFVFSPSLKILRIYNPAYGFGYCYVVEAPKLKYLDFSVNSLSRFTMTCSTSLVSAVMDFGTFIYGPNPLSAIELFQGISDVRNLELSTHNTIMVKDELSNIPELHNLIHLKIGRCKNWDIFSCILQRSPNLKHLIIDTQFFEPKRFRWNPPEGDPKCLTMHLETIEISSVNRRHEEKILEIIEYLLDKGKVLKKMDIASIHDKKVLEKLSRSDARLCFPKE